MSNEDLWELRQLVEGLGGSRLGAWPPTHGGAEAVAQVGVGAGTNLGALGKGDAVLVIASDLEEEVPIWRLRLKQAQDRGAYLVVANSRHTRLEDFAVQGVRNYKVVSGDAIRYEAGTAVKVMTDLKKKHKEISDKLAKANNLVIVAGAEGLTLQGSQALAQAVVNFLIDTDHVGKSNNGLLIPLPGANGMGLHYLGYSPETTLDIIANPPKVLIVAQSELLDDDPRASNWLSTAETVIYANFFQDATAELSDYVLPIQSFAERDGTFVNGERRVQRFYTAQGPMGNALPAWKLFGSLRQQLGLDRLKASAAAVMVDIAKNVEVFGGLNYKALANAERQLPEVGGKDLYYGGTAYANHYGVGVQIACVADNNRVRATSVKEPITIKADKGEVLVIPITRLYNRQQNLRPTLLVKPRVLSPYVVINDADAKKNGISQGDVVEVKTDNVVVRVCANVTDKIEKGSVALPRHLTDTATPMMVTVGTINKVTEGATYGD